MILVTGGAGYIGSHTVIELLKNQFEILVIDNFSNSTPAVLDTIKQISGKNFEHHCFDLCDYKMLLDTTNKYNIEGIIHFAAYKAVGESVNDPIKYYQNNIQSLTNVLKLCKDRKIKNFVFSSSCTVYGNPDEIPVTETTPIKNAESPYGKTKIFSEEIINDFQKVNNIATCKLRYFNPIGAHESGLIGDCPSGIPNNLLPYLTQVASGLREELSVYGNDYNTPDGTCIRDYIHVTDLAKAHVKALQYNTTNPNSNTHFNIGTGKGYSVLELIKTFEKVNNVKLNYTITKRRQGDVEAIFADCSLSKESLNWAAELGLEEMLKSAWNFQLKNNK